MFPFPGPFGKYFVISKFSAACGIEGDPTPFVPEFTNWDDA